MSKIHPTAIISAGAELDSSVTVGPYSVIGPHVRIGAGTTVAINTTAAGTGAWSLSVASMRRMSQMSVPMP